MHGGTREPIQQSSPVCPWQPGTGPWAVASGRSRRRGQHNALAGRGLPCSGGERRRLPAQATMQRPLRKCRHEETLGMLPLPPPHPRHPVEVCPGRGLQCRRAPAPPAQPVPWKVAPVGRGDTSSPCSRGAEPPEQCQHCLLLWETKPRHAKVETWPVCKQAPGPWGFLYKGCWFGFVCFLWCWPFFFFLEVIYFQVRSIRAIPHQEIFLFVFHGYQDSEKLTSEMQSKHPSLVSVSGE